MTSWDCEFNITKPSTKVRCKNGPCQACIDVANVDKEINQAVTTLRRLLLKRCDLRSDQNRVHDVLVHRLPLELKNYVFELLLPSRNEWGRTTLNGVPGRVIMPSYLTSICRGWRDIAWSNPLLWSKIQIRLGTKSWTPDLHSRINFVHKWILRSQNMPLTLHIIVHEQVFEEELKGVVDVISQCSNRWHSLSLDIPSKELSAFHRNNFQCHLLKRLRIISRKERRDEPVPFLNLEVGPEEIEINGLSFQSLQISWNHLSSAKVESFSLKEITQLFQHALQMTHCRISSPRRGARNFSMFPITHQMLKSLSLYCCADVGPMLLHSLTLPRLQEFDTDEMALLTPASLPALGQGRPKIGVTWRVSSLDLDDLQPLPGVNHLVLGFSIGHDEFKKLVEECLPDMRRLTLEIKSFLSLWQAGIIHTMLERKRPPPDVANQERHLRILVRGTGDSSSLLRGIVRGLEPLKLEISSREDGLELLIPW